MGAAMLTGLCWHTLLRTVSGFAPIPLDRLIFCTIRDFDAGQRGKIDRLRVAAVIGALEHPVDYPHLARPVLAYCTFPSAVADHEECCGDDEYQKRQHTHQRLLESVRATNPRRTRAVRWPPARVVPRAGSDRRAGLSPGRRPRIRARPTARRSCGRRSCARPIAPAPVR